MKQAALLLIILFSSALSFSQVANRYDVIIDEIMADPAPQVGLPNNEWIELKNISSAPVNLQGWRIGDITALSGPLPNFILQPDSFVIICTASAVAALSVFGNAISVTSFPSLDNDGDQLYLQSSQNKIIHAIAYSISWYQNELKKEGGWTLEMIDTKNPCTGMSNWKASTHVSGGTPGKRNSVDGSNADQAAPQLKKTYTTDSVTIIAVFDEPLDSLKAANTSNYTIDGLNIISATVLNPLFNQVQLKLNSKLLSQKTYQLTANNITDCKGNIIGSQNKASAGLPEDALTTDIVINEILFNPRSNAFDYVEFYNRSNKIIDVSRLHIANRNSNGAISSIKQISAVPVYIFPGEYMVVTEDAASLQLNYLVKNPDALLVLAALPSYPDDEGDVILLNFQGNIVDEVKYKDDWHFKLIDNAEGVALERIDAEGLSQNAANWHSAASTAGYGTPGYQNSQYRQLQNINATVEIIPKVFSPDNDGNDDILTIQYQLAEPGYVANITIFNAGGRPVRYLVKNGTLALKGNCNWDGLDEKGNKLPVGTYIIITEIFNLQGKKEQFKNAAVLARKLN